MARASRFALLSVACVGCWFDIADIDLSATQTSSSAGGAPPTTSTAQGGQGGALPVSGGGGAGGLGGDGGSGGELGGSGGTGPEPAPFKSCVALGYIGECAGPAAELLFFFETEYDRPECEHTPTVSEACYVNDCTISESQCGPRETGTCDDLRCGVFPGVGTRCPDAYTAAGECLYNVAIRRVSPTDCEFRDCSLVTGWQCRDGSDGEPNADCFAPP